MLSSQVCSDRGWHFETDYNLGLDDTLNSTYQLFIKAAGLAETFRRPDNSDLSELTYEKGLTATAHLMLT